MPNRLALIHRYHLRGAFATAQGRQGESLCWWARGCRHSQCSAPSSQTRKHGEAGAERSVCEPDNAKIEAHLFKEDPSQDGVWTQSHKRWDVTLEESHDPQFLCF